MKKRPKKPLTNSVGDVRQLLAEDIKAMRPAADILPADLVATLPKRKRGQRGPQKTPTKTMVTLRLDPDVLNRFKSDGPGWQGRINQALRKAVG